MESLIEIELLILKKSVGRGSFLSPTLGANKESKKPCQIELNMSFTYTKMFIDCFSREQLPSIVRQLSSLVRQLPSVIRGVVCLSQRRFHFLPNVSRCV